MMFSVPDKLICVPMLMLVISCNLFCKINMKLYSASGF